MIFDSSNVLLLRQHKYVTDKLIARLKNFNISGIYIEDGITQGLVPSRPVLNTKVKAQTLTNIEWLFTNSAENEKKDSSARTKREKERHMEQIDRTVATLIDIIKKSESTQVNINDLKSYDDYTYHHSLSVAILSLAIGSQLKLSEPELRRRGCL